ncbi:hypothetical protein FRACA_170039 [Frankia canadensis]|uniref:Barstar (barnase inhibitor) domain-containing protein n=1 Tax=Frankia canadensis TaxID=1836972 RepID=A0A2I2KN53_9ACTN|nr:hypothetical protein [Frankia canadensis]SNQ47079.1 hypothetical protein FRACA_170039 [Frankia canadensis]SOU54369.1 hypothetical protein FRACA_170039 [Frankia canadensis]
MNLDDRALTSPDSTGTPIGPVDVTWRDLRRMGQDHADVFCGIGDVIDDFWSNQLVAVVIPHAKILGSKARSATSVALLREALNGLPDDLFLAGGWMPWDTEGNESTQLIFVRASDDDENDDEAAQG